MKTIRYYHFVDGPSGHKDTLDVTVRDFRDDGGLLAKTLCTATPYIRFMSPLEYADRLSFGQNSLTMYDNIDEMFTHETSFLSDTEMIELMGATTGTTHALADAHFSNDEDFGLLL